MIRGAQDPVRSHFPFPDDAAPQDPSIWRAGGEGIDPEKANEITRHLADLAFGDAEHRAAGRPLPFYPLSRAAEDVLSPQLKAEYLFELRAACDYRSGPRTIVDPDADYGPETLAVLQEYDENGFRISDPKN